MIIPARIFSILALFLLLTVGFVFLHLSRASVPTYQDQPFGYWFTKLPLTLPSSLGGSEQILSFTLFGQRYGDPMGPSASLQALQAFGTDACPDLVAKLMTDDGWAERRVYSLLYKKGLSSVPLPCRHAEAERYQAISGLVFLGDQLPPRTLQILAQLSTNANPDVASASAFVLRTVNTQTSDGKATREEPGIDLLPWSNVESVMSDRRTWIDDNGFSPERNAEPAA